MKKEFIYNFKVYYEDTDAGGVVYYANYLKFLERARSEAIYSIGFSNLDLKRTNEAVEMISNDEGFKKISSEFETDIKNISKK